MDKYKHISGKFGIDENYYLTDIETGIHCLGKIINKDTGKESENITKLKLPKNIDGFSIRIPWGDVLISHGDKNIEFGTISIQYYDNSKINEKKVFNSLLTNALEGDKDSTLALVIKLAHTFYTLKEITSSNIKDETYGKLCFLFTHFSNDFCLNFKFAQVGSFTGNSDCMNLLGHYYEYGIGVERNQKLAFKWYMKAAKNGNVESMGRLAQFYRWNNEACVINPHKSFYWAEKASKHGYIWEWERVGFAYMYGDGTCKNYNKAIYWFKKICNLTEKRRKNCTRRFAEILYNLGLFSFYGIGTKKDINFAFDCFSKSADEGSDLTCEALAYFYENGIIVE